MKLNLLLIGMIIILLGTAMYLRHNLTKQQNQTLELIDQNIKLEERVYRLKMENHDLKNKQRKEELQKEVENGNDT